MGGGPTRERGRPARMHYRCVPLSSPGVQRPYSRPGGGDGRGCARTCAGGTPALPGGLHPV